MDKRGDMAIAPRVRMALRAGIAPKVRNECHLCVDISFLVLSWCSQTLVDKTYSFSYVGHEKGRERGKEGVDGCDSLGVIIS